MDVTDSGPQHLDHGPYYQSTCPGCQVPNPARPTPVEPEAPRLRAALERLIAVSLVEEEDQSPATQDEWIAALKQASDALDSVAVEPDEVQEWLDAMRKMAMLPVKRDD